MPLSASGSRGDGDVPQPKVAQKGGRGVYVWQEMEP